NAPSTPLRTMTGWMGNGPRVNGRGVDAAVAHGGERLQMRAGVHERGEEAGVAAGALQHAEPAALGVAVVVRPASSAQVVEALNVRVGAHDDVREVDRPSR